MGGLPKDLRGALSKSRGKYHLRCGCPYLEARYDKIETHGGEVMALQCSLCLEVVVPKECPHCKKSFLASIEMSRPRTYCSDVCKGRAKRDRNVELKASSAENILKRRR